MTGPPWLVKGGMLLSDGSSKVGLIFCRTSENLNLGKMTFAFPHNCLKLLSKAYSINKYPS